MKFLFDLFPVILFFVAYKFAQGSPDAATDILSSLISSHISGTQAPILVATLVAMVATAAQIGWLIVRRKKIDTMLWISFALITFFGGATLISHNSTFIKWKPTVLHWLFAVVLGGARLLFDSNLVKKMMGEQIVLPETVWKQLNTAWVLFFTVMGFVNLYVAYSFSENTWVNFKLYGVLGLTLLFVIGQGFMIAKYVEDKS